MTYATLVTHDVCYTTGQWHMC